MQEGHADRPGATPHHPHAERQSVVDVDQLEPIGRRVIPNVQAGPRLADVRDAAVEQEHAVHSGGPCPVQRTPPLAPFVQALNDPLLRPLRRVIPPVGGLDLTVLVALILIQIAQYLLRQVFYI